MIPSRSTSFNQLAWLFVVAYVMAMFIPRVVVEGMFADGLCYSSISRNLAEGKGSIWAPYFSSSFWLPYNAGTVYYENMPMLFWLQAPFFWLLGEAWWVEKLFCAILVLGTLLLTQSTWKATRSPSNMLMVGYRGFFCMLCRLCFGLILSIN
ncbi:MAG: hypothetical protein U0Y10_23255 [Spirosomataceae bacterium]